MTPNHQPHCTERHSTAWRASAVLLLLLVCTVAVTLTVAPTVTPAVSSPRCILRSKHLLFGIPNPIDDRYQLDADGDGENEPGISLLVREGFVVGHADRFKVPLWVAMQWTRDDWERSSSMASLGRSFKPDLELPEYARAGNDYEHGRTEMDRGHMARHRDNSAWGEDNSAAGCLMSNISPQHKNLNRGPWLLLEDAHRNIVADQSSRIERIWVISGTIVTDTPEKPVSTLGNGVAIPQSLFKIIAWLDTDDALCVRAYLYPQDAVMNDPTVFLTSVDTIEAAAGIDFFPTLDDSYEAALESKHQTSMW